MTYQLRPGEFAKLAFARGMVNAAFRPTGYEMAGALTGGLGGGLIGGGLGALLGDPGFGAVAGGALGATAGHLGGYGTGVHHVAEIYADEARRRGASPGQADKVYWNALMGTAIPHFFGPLPGLVGAPLFAHTMSGLPPEPNQSTPGTSSRSAPVSS